jgi:rhomboid protease GluP
VRNLLRSPATSTLLAAILLTFVLDAASGFLLRDKGAIIPWLIREGEYWRLLTAMFLHANLLHLLVNLVALFQLGSLYELMFGTRRFVLIYVVSGLAASLTSMMRIDGASVGASGAIFGILGAFVFSVFRSPRFRHERAARNLVAQCVFWIIANIAIGFQIPQIDNAAHIGGLVAGLLLGGLLPHRPPPPPPPGRVTIDVLPYDD